MKIGKVVDWDRRFRLINNYSEVCSSGLVVVVVGAPM